MFRLVLQLRARIVCHGLCKLMEEKMETTIVHWDTIGIIEKKMETAIVYWGVIYLYTCHVGCQ